MPLTPNERQLRARMAAHASWANTADTGTRTAPGLNAANAANWTRFENEVDPDRVLDPAERTRRAEHARKAYMLQLSYKAAQARRLKRAS